MIKQTRRLGIEKRLAQRVMVEESTRHKVVKSESTECITYWLNVVTFKSKSVSLTQIFRFSFHIIIYLCTMQQSFTFKNGKKKENASKSDIFEILPFKYILSL